MRGDDTFRMAEPHFQPEGTELMWHPLRLAEDYAVADILTGGRVIFASSAAAIPVKWKAAPRP